MTRLPPGSRLSLWPLGVLMVIMMTIVAVMIILMLIMMTMVIELIILMLIMMTMVIVMMILMLTILMKLMIDVTAVTQEEEQGWKRH